MNVDMIDIMLPAFVECLVLVGIHSYLGIHVIKRKVIFVDLALAQIAALGSTFAFLFGINPTSAGGYWFSLGFTIMGAAIFSVSRLRHEKIPQEAVIGLVYALAAASAILVIDKAPHGAEQLKEILTGSILWVKWETIIIAAVVYAIVGSFHFIFRNKFLLISYNPEMAYRQGINVRLWDFLFYVSFGIVITHSVSTAGVLLVFVFLVVPAIATIMITEKLWLQLVLGWSMGTLVSILGLYISYVADLPSGPAVVVTYGLVLLVTTLMLYVIKAAVKWKALRNIGFGFAVFFATVLIFWLMGQGFRAGQEHDHAMEINGSLTDSEHHHESEIFRELTDQELQVMLLKQENPDSLLELYGRISNPFQKFEIAHRLYDLNRTLGSEKLIDYLNYCQIPFLRQKALEILMLESQQSFGYDALKSPQENQPALERWQKWWREKY